MKKEVQIVATVLCVGILFTCAVFAGPIRPQEVSADAVWAAHLDMERLVSSRIGGLFLRELEDQGELAKINAFGTVFDFNPIEDLYSVTAYGTSFGKEEAVGLIKGRIDKQKVLALMQMEGTQKKISHRDDTIHNWTKGSDCFFVCFCTESLILFSNSLDLTKGALDVLRGEKENLANGGKLRDLRSLPDGTFFAGAVNGFAEIAGLDPKAAILKKAQKATIAAGEVEGTDFVNISLTAADEAAATQIHAVAQGILALGSMMGEQEPELARLVQTARLTLESRNITLRQSMPADELMNFLKGSMKHK